MQNQSRWKKSRKWKHMKYDNERLNCIKKNEWIEEMKTTKHECMRVEMNEVENCVRSRSNSLCGCITAAAGTSHRQVSHDRVWDSLETESWNQTNIHREI